MPKSTALAQHWTRPQPHEFLHGKAKQRDSAGCLGSEVRITYPYHPRCGQAVAVLGNKRHAGSSHFVVRQPDGTLSLLPSWMTESAASANRMHLPPRLPIERLVDLRCLVDALLASLQGESVPGERVHDACSEAKSARSVQATGCASAASPGGAGETGTSAEIPSDGGRLRAAGPDSHQRKRAGGRR